MFKFSGWPESMRLMSGSGPLGPILNGVWQSMQAGSGDDIFAALGFSAAFLVGRIGGRQPGEAEGGDAGHERDRGGRANGAMVASHGVLSFRE
jgi:hypothetical protein